MTKWREWFPVALVGAAAVVGAYLIGVAPVSANPAPAPAPAPLAGCQTCTCKNIYAWKVMQDSFAQGLVDNTGAPVLYGFTGICVLNCPNTPNVQYYNQLDRRQYNDPVLTCDNNMPPSLCRGVTQEADGTLTQIVLGQTTRAECTAPPPPRRFP